MRILQGSKVIEAPPGIIEAIRAHDRRIVVDLGAGDGKYVYESARADPGTLYVAIDPDAATLADYAFRASRKAARGGLDNAIFVVAPVEALPSELSGIADIVRVNFPWGSLMRGLLAPERETVRAVLGLAKPDGHIEIAASYDPSHDTGAFQGPPLPALEAAYLESALVPAYEDAGAGDVAYRRMTQDEALAIPSTWGRRLLHARPRDVFWIAMKAQPSR